MKCVALFHKFVCHLDGFTSWTKILKKETFRKIVPRDSRGCAMQSRIGAYFGEGFGASDPTESKKLAEREEDSAWLLLKIVC
jgi:hypothetical protein